MRITAIAAGALFVVAIFFTGNKPAHAQPLQNKNQNTKKPIVYVIREGDSLSKIAQKHKTTYVRIYNANKNIKNPDLIYPGQKIRIPLKDEKLTDRNKAVVSPGIQYKPDNSYVPYQKAASQPTYSQSSNGSVWDKIANCESGGNWATNTGNGYYGGLQFSLSSWHSVGGSGLPSIASKAEQISRAKILQSRQGWGAWPVCSIKAGV